MIAIGRLPAAPEYYPYRKLGDRPNIIVDGSPLSSTVLTLSHWPNNNTPAALRRDTSTEIVFAYLAQPDFHVQAPFVSNNHFDEDGLFGMFSLCYPELATQYQTLLIDASRAGDFGYFDSRDAARLVFCVETCADPATSDLPREVFNACAANRVPHLYREMLARLPVLLEDLAAAKELWSEQDEHLEDGLAMFADGRLSIEEYSEADLAVVRIPEGLPPRMARRYISCERAPVHPFAIHQQTQCSRILRMENRRYELQFRYEGWVQLASRRPALRVALDGLAERLNDRETAPGQWLAEAVTEVAPRLYLDGVEGSSIDPDTFLSMVLSYLDSAPIAWDPYDWQPTEDTKPLKESA